MLQDASKCKNTVWVQMLLSNIINETLAKILCGKLHAVKVWQDSSRAFIPIIFWKNTIACAVPPPLSDAVWAFARL